MHTLSLDIAVAVGHVATRILVTSLVLALVATLALTSALAVWSALDVAFYIVEAVHESATDMVSLSFHGHGVAPTEANVLHN